jgi:hypothetical protein
MTTPHRMPPRGQPAASRDRWRDSETLYLLRCYDIWSATPPRGCECGAPLPTAD